MMDPNPATDRIDLPNVIHMRPVELTLRDVNGAPLFKLVIDLPVYLSSETQMLEVQSQNPSTPYKLIIRDLAAEADLREIASRTD